MNTPMHENHLKQISESRKQSLTAAGIHVSLHERNLTTIDCGASVGDWLAENVTSIKAGRTWLVETLTKDQALVLPLIARALHLRGTGCKVVRLGTLVRAVEMRSYQDLDSLVICDALFVLDFFESTRKPMERPFTAHQKRQIEDVLLHRVALAKTNILQVSNPTGCTQQVGTSQPSEWWDQSFLLGLQALSFKAGKE